MNTIKKQLLKLLDAEPKRDSAAWVQHWQSDGVRMAITEIREYAQSLYGLPSDKWCEKMYKHIDDYYNLHTPKVYKKEDFKKDCLNCEYAKLVVGQYGWSYHVCSHPAINGKFWGDTKDYECPMPTR